MDLNLFPVLKQPFGVSGEKRVCCGPCESDPIIVHFDVSKAGYVPGERILFKAFIDNKSNRKIYPLRLELIETITFYASTKSKTSTRKLCSIINKVIEPHGTHLWNDGIISIPPVCPSSNGFCKIINIKYFLNLHMSLASSVSKEFCIPITIGNYA